MVTVRRLILTSLLVVGITSTTAVADDASASFVTRLFIDVCVPNVGQAENVRAWALEKKLAEVTSPSALEVFVGAGDGGAAWAVPTSFGSFALSIRGRTHACATWARTADPEREPADIAFSVGHCRTPEVHDSPLRVGTPVKSTSPAASFELALSAMSGRSRLRAGGLKVPFTRLPWYGCS